ncbi:iron-containing alcohol dehydrogenase [Fredinandcohnia onubensis]|uniref:iron-containing alcohol dehydrogenase n=1 Tax=Fredinandcohnia onubensis TaxID=1571209 RepID=UPI000C0C1058|nr:iron-containing alcohol dehydrogenase [Fredinandcohnia onubensis]
MIKEQSVVSVGTDFRMPDVFRFGVGSLSTLVDSIEKFDAKRVAIISDKGLEKAGLVNKVTALLEPLPISLVTYTNISGEPTFQMLQDAVQVIESENCDLIVGIGGGSALDVAKATAALSGKEDLSPYISGEKTIEARTINCILLPTTSGTGSEVTMNAIFGDETQGVKRGIVSPVLLPDVAIIDPELSLSCPPRVTAASGVDALTHAIESYISTKATPLTRIYSEKAIRLFPSHITKAVHYGNDIEARTGMSWVSSLAGVGLANAGVGAVHALAYPLGGQYHIEHGVANALLMPFVFEVIGTACLEDIKDITAFLGIGDSHVRQQDSLEVLVDYLYDLLVDLDLPTSLSQLGVPEESLPALAEQASKIDRLLRNTPYNLGEQKILKIYQNAFKGKGGK